MINKRFSIIKLLGEGRSKVFLCEDRFFPSQKFAIKILPFQAGEEEIKTFTDEYQLLKKFSHPNIVKAYESGIILDIAEEEKALGIEDGSCFSLLEYCDGKSLLDIDFRSKQKMLLDLIGQLSSFLSYLHFAKYIYFDLKFENIICSEKGESLSLKIIDFGLTKRSDSILPTTQRGTAFYIAPEILQNKKVDSRADLYSLGILLYHLVYGKFPFSVNNELEIYRAHLEDEFLFSESSSFSPAIIKVIKRLLKKNPSERIHSALQLLSSLKLPIENFNLNFVSATEFIERKTELAVITEYIENKERNEVFVIQGTYGSGKSFLAAKISNEYQNVIFVEKLSTHNPGLILQNILSRIIFSSSIYNEFNGKDAEYLKVFDDNVRLDIETLIARFSEISKAKNFILILDDYNLLDEVVKEILLRIIPILQVNGCKIILLEDQPTGSSSVALPNKIELQLSPFFQKEILVFLEENFSSSFPLKTMATLIKKYADLYPGNILLFINELIANKVLIFSKDGILVDEEKVQKFSGVTQDAAFKKRITNLTDNEKEALLLLSSFEVDLTLAEAKIFLDKMIGETDEILINLKKKNLIHIQSSDSFIQFNSIGLKNYIYSSIENKVEHHIKIIAVFSTANGISPKEISRHFALAEKYDDAYLCLKDEIERASELSAFVYVSNLYSRLLQLPLSKNIAVKVRKDFLQILQKTGDSEQALQILNVLETVYKIKLDTELLIKKGVFLIASGKIDSGKKILVEEVNKIQDKNEKTEILLEIAKADLNTNKFTEAQTVLNQLSSTKYLTNEQNGKTHNLTGLLELYKNNDTEKAFSSFLSALKEFTKADLKQNIARVQVNLGNICSMRGHYMQAEKYWQSSLSINHAIGDLEQEALLQMNYGIFLFDTAKYEQAVDSYKNAKKIFKAIGKKNGLGLSLLNSAETHLIICEYSTAIDELSQALDIFRLTENKEEEASTYYLFAKTFAIIGSWKNAMFYTEQYQKFVLDEHLSEKHLLQLKFIDALTRYYSGEEIVESDEDEILSLCYALLETDNKHDTVLASLIYIDFCLFKKEFEPAHTFLQNEKFIELCSVNEIYRAVRLYLLGKLSQQYKFDENSYTNYLNEAYEIIKGQSITEFTRLILNLLCKIYFERNLFIKGKEFFNLTESLIVFLSNNITDNSIREAYLTQKERSENLQFIRNSLSTLL
ncbi:MAG: protein kinase [Ignavibacteriaceae bacterium]|jgi:serine/threonine protein kinase/tetratricopeptide (TPR) repeat protein